MLQYDLTRTPLAECDEFIAVPTEAELLGILVGLLVVHDRSYCELASRPLTLARERCEDLATTLERSIPQLVRDFGDASQLRNRLR